MKSQYQSNTRASVLRQKISPQGGPSRDLSKGEYLTLVGVREHNLKNISLTIPHNRLVAITGLSGSGKTSLAYDTIYAEGGRRYIETFSPYTRQFLDRLRQPELDSVNGVRPSLALEQRNRSTNSRSTVGTVTEINDYLKVVWTHLADIFCPHCQTPIPHSTPFSVRETIYQESEKQRSNGSSPFDTLLITFPLRLNENVSLRSLGATLEQEGFVRFFDSTEKRIIALQELDESARGRSDEIFVIVDRLPFPFQETPSQDERTRLLGSLNQAYTFGHGELVSILCARTQEPTQEIRPQLSRFREFPQCPSCEFQPPRRTSAIFTFNSPLGACPTCHGFGKVLRTDPALIIPDPHKTISEGAVACWSTPASKREAKRLRSFCEQSGIDIHTPWKDLLENQRETILSGEKTKKGYPGVYRWFEWLGQKRHKMHVRIFIARFRSEATCDTCQGSRLRPEALSYRLGGKTLPDIWNMSIEDLLPFFQMIRAQFSHHPLADIAIEEVCSRLHYLEHIGLGYLTLDRQTRTLSGGENQRVNLTALLGACLVNTTLVLDEPTIGLHPTDTYRLIDSMRSLRDRGNTVLVVEHDTEVIHASDEVIDIGPESGNRGGEVLFQGTPEDLTTEKRSYTAQALRGESPIQRRKNPSDTSSPPLVVHNARANNLRGIDVEIPLKKFVVLTGVSGSGKSSFVEKCLSKPFLRLQQGADPVQLFGSEDAPLSGYSGREHISELVLIDQSPVGKTPRANPATYTKAWDIIRDCLAETEAAQTLGLSRSAFSFNVDGGRCPTCKGAGHLRIEMQFLADVFVQCEACGGYRFQDKVLSVRFAGRNVIELLDTSLEEIVEIFRSLGEEHRVAKAAHLLRPLLDLGLGYLRLGHPLSEMSGGEAQRLKLASYLLETPTHGKQPHYLFVLDEPTTGLHPHNVHQLLGAFDKLLKKGHSVLCVEHNLDVIRHADWMIELGPGAGKHGGNLVVSGVPEELVNKAALVKNSKTLSALVRSNAREGLLQGEVSPRKGRQTSTAQRSTPNLRSHRDKPPILIQGATHHNLKNVTVEIPQEKLCVITGVSGSGKSSLAFDILFAEGQRRYIDCLSPYARQYMKQLSRAAVERVINIPPTIAVSQKTSPPLGISTVSTTTEIYQFLRLLFSKIGTQHCPRDNTPIAAYSKESLAEEIIERFGKKRIFLFAPVVSGRKGNYQDLFQRALRAEITEARVDDKIVRISEDLRLERHKLHWISLLVASINKPEQNPQLLREAVSHSLLLGGGTIEIVTEDKHGNPEILSTERLCPTCKRGYRALDPQDFSFRSSRGVCQSCQGRGVVAAQKKKRERVVGEQICPECHGARISALGRHVYLQGRTIHDLASSTPQELLSFFETFSYEERLHPIVEPILKELTHRLRIIISVGLDYLGLDREANSISGGEAQRLRLAKSLGSPLSGVCYILDEPSIGLHPQDQSQLMSTLANLRDTGNTVIVVEHDEELIRQAEHIIDIGPAGGARGGELVYSGSVDGLIRGEKDSFRSLTGKALRERTAGASSKITTTQRKKSGELLIKGATTNNLKNIDVKIPLGCVTVVCGVSGAGKSSLLHGTVVPAITSVLLEESPEVKTWQSLMGSETLERLVEIDQTPVGKTITSTPASFLGIFDEIRKLYASLPEAKIRGWGQSHFSFNSGKGRCSDCSGRGFIKIPMSFLPEATSTCESCQGLRYNESTKEVLFMGLSIGEVLQRTIAEAHEIFANHKRIRRALDTVMELGLGYVTLGQPTYTLSGGETQRLKIARELGSREATKTFYVLDEPTVGLHMTDVDKLLRVLHALVDKGNTVVVIEHNLDVILSADFLIEVGPGPGEQGGQVLFTGTPKALKEGVERTPTWKYLQTDFHSPSLQPESLENRRHPKKLSLTSSTHQVGIAEQISQKNGV